MDTEPFNFCLLDQISVNLIVHISLLQLQPGVGFQFPGDMHVPTSELPKIMKNGLHRVITLKTHIGLLSQQ